MKNTEKAFLWVTDILEKKGIVYKISGGLAARTYGVNRELADIDIEIADKDIDMIVGDVKPYVIFGPARFIDADWDLELMTLSYAGQEIDIAGSDAKIFNKITGQWENCSGDSKSIELKEIFGKKVPVESRESLIVYKSKLSREVDLEDIKQLKRII